MSALPDARALSAGGAATLGGALAKILIRFLDYKYPGFSNGITDSIDTISVGFLAGLGAYITRSAPSN